MYKRTKLSIVSTICYAIFLFGGLGIAGYMFYLVQENNNTGGDAGLAALGYAFLMIIGLAYAAVSLLPFIFATCDIKANKKIFAGLCLPFDIALTVAGASFTLSAFGEGSSDPVSLIFNALLMVIAIVALVCNLASLKCDKYD